MTTTTTCPVSGATVPAPGSQPGTTGTWLDSLSRRDLLNLVIRSHGLEPVGFDTEASPITGGQGGTDRLRHYLLARYGLLALEAARRVRPAGCLCRLCSGDSTTGGTEPVARPAQPVAPEPAPEPAGQADPQAPAGSPAATTAPAPEPAPEPSSPQPAAAQPAPADSLETIVRAIARDEAAQVATQVAQPLDVDQVRAIAADEASKVARPERLVFVDPVDPSVLRPITGHARPELEGLVKVALASQAARLAGRAPIHCLLTGPAGTGKTTLGRQVAEALGWDSVVIGCAGSTPVRFTGRLLPVGQQGTFQFVASEHLEAIEAGNCVIVYDELDAADPNDLLVLNDLLSSGRANVDGRIGNPQVVMGPNVFIIATANTFGTGADVMFQRERLDASTLDRFVSRRFIGYQPELEDAVALPELVTWVRQVRRNLEAGRVRRWLSTRWLASASDLVASGAETLEQVKASAMLGWTDQDRTTALAGVR